MSSDATISIQTYGKSELEGVNIIDNFQSQAEIKEQFNDDTNGTIFNDSLLVSESEKEMNTTLNEEIIFSMGKEKLKYDLKTAIKACPALVLYISKINTPNAKITINLPQWIKRNALLEYFVYFKKNALVDSSTLNYFNILRLSDCFENTAMLNNIIKTKIIPTLSFDSALLFLQEAYKKIEQNNLNYNWYELFSTTKEFISANIIQYIQNDNQKICQLHRILLEEIIEHHILSTNDIEVELIDFLMKICNCNNVYDLIAHEALLASSDENNESLLNSSYCLIQYAIKESGNIYQELKKKFNKSIDVIFFVYYKTSEDILKVNFKIVTEDQGKLYSFSILCYFEGGEDRRQYKTNKLISNSKGNVNVLQLHHFRQKKSSKLVINIKMNAIHSFTLQYLTLNFKSYIHDPNIVKLPMILLREMLFIGKSRSSLTDEDALSSISLWLSDEINSNDESLPKLFEVIDWNKIKKSALYAFIVREANIIDKTELYPYFINELKIEEALIAGIRQANYSKLLSENNQLKKTLELFKSNQTNANFNKEVSEIKKTIEDKHSNNLFNESDKDEAKQYLPLSSKNSKHSFNRNRMRNKAQDMNGIYDSINELQCQCQSTEKVKTDYQCRLPVKTIEYEINSNKFKDINIGESINHDVLETPTNVKIKQMKEIKQSKGTFGNILNTMQSCSLHNNNYKTKETSTVTQRSDQSIQSDKSLSSFDQMQNKIKHPKIESSSKQKKLFTIKKIKPQIAAYYKNKYTLQE